MDEKDLKTILEKHSKWHNGDKGGSRADLTGADLTVADLAEANLTGANLDYSSWPLWCILEEAALFTVGLLVAIGILTICHAGGLL